MAVKPQPLPGEAELIAKILGFADDPLSYVMFKYPWGVPNTPLANIKQPRDWQLDDLITIRDGIRRNRRLVAENKPPRLIRIARASGRGIGKTAQLAWLSQWMMDCHPSATTIVSANTESQLKDKTFPEIKKWASMAINAHWYEHNAMSIKPAQWLIDAMKKTTKMDDAYWYIQASLWSEENPDAFAGAHSQQGMAVLFDEASGIPPNIWPVTEGFFTDRTVHRLWYVISNPRNPSGAFFECFNKNRMFWDHKHIDARTVVENDPEVYDAIIAANGPDSNEARIEVYGQFPKQGDFQFISRADVEEAATRDVQNDPGAPLLMGVDPARFGDDKAVLAYRKGKDARTIKPKAFPKMSLTDLAQEVITSAEVHKPDAIFIEGDGVGGGLVDILKAFGMNVIEVKTGGGATDKNKYANHRTEMWGQMRDWLVTGAIDDEETIITDLTAPEYKYTLKGQLQLESKDVMKKRGYASPDYADALAVTFSRKIPRLDMQTHRVMRGKRRLAKNTNYNIFG